MERVARPLAARWRDQLVAADPGGFNLRIALCATLGLAIAAILLVFVARAGHAPVSVPVLGAVMAMMAGVAISDATPRAQLVTLVLGLAAAMASIALAAAIAGSTWGQSLVLCAIVFVVVLVRGRGPRGMGIGMLAFMGYFFALYVRARPAQLPALIGAVAIAGVVAYLVRFWLVRERPGGVRRRVLHAFRARVQLLLDDVAADAAAGGRGERRWRRIRRATGRIDELALGLEQAVGRGPDEAPAEEARGWIGDLLRAEVAIDMLAHAAHDLAAADPTGAVGAELARTIDALQPWVREGDERARSEALARFAVARELGRGDAAPRDVDAQWWRTARGLDELAARRPWTAFPDVAPARSKISMMTFRPGGGGASGASGMSLYLRLAIQATVAVALSIVAGRELSQQRWYWAVIASFVVFIRAATVGETASRAWQRSLGTVIGVLVGLALAELIGHATGAVIAIGFVAVFAAFYLVRIAYPAMIAAFTMALALFYGALHEPVPGLMELRLYETLVGAAIGVLVAAIVLPTRSDDRVRALLADLAHAAGDAIARVTARAAADRPDAELQDAIRHVDVSLAELRNALRPLWGPLVPYESRAFARRGRAAAGLAYATRSFAMVPRGARDPDVHGAGEALARASHALGDALACGRPGAADDVLAQLPPPGPAAAPVSVLLAELAAAIAQLRDAAA